MPKALKDLKKLKKKHPEAKGLTFLALSLFLLLTLLSFLDGHPEANWLGLFGHAIAWGFQYVFGLGSYLILGYLIWIGWRALIFRDSYTSTYKLGYFLIFLVSSCFLLNLIAETRWIDLSFFYGKVYSETAIFHLPVPIRYTRFNLGGVPFYYLFRDLPHGNLQNLLSNIGVLITFSMTGIISFILLTDLSFFRTLKSAFQIFPMSYDMSVLFLKKVLKIIQKTGKKTILEPEFVESPRSSSHPFARTPPREKSPFKKEEAPKKRPFEYTPPPVKEESQFVQPLEITLKEESETKTESQPFFLKKSKKREKGPSNYDLPPLSLLTDAKKVDQTGLKKELKIRADILEETLQSFSIEAKVGHIFAGPTVTLFEVHPAIGVKVQKIKALENDIALNLQAKSIRIIAPIPGKAAVGVEIPSLYPQEVGFKEMLSVYRNLDNKFHIPMLLGKTVSGDDVMCDLTKMPHCIIAGATGSGKSVCINTIIMSILMNLSPDEIRLILIDPKKVELTPFSKLPHLIAPVITEAKGAYAALQWIVKEMQYRYELLKRLGVRNISSFNERKIDKELEDGLEMEVPEKLYFIVCIIDEFADLMMSSSSDLETPIARIAQMARAVGIHLILATQRPSREVITGLIKANFPTRIAFKVSSRINSQIILDENGAESLLGNGDMLFLPPGTSQLIRCQGVYVRDEDIFRVVSHITDKIPTHYILESFENLEPTFFMKEPDESVQGRDPLYEKALELVLESRTASTTFLQRKLKIGYARAASLIDELEQNGIIGPQDGSRPRRILKDFSD